MHSFIHFSFNSSWTLNIKLTLQIFPLSGSSEESPSSYKGKHHPAVFSSHTFLQHSFTSGTRPVGFPYIKQLCPMSWVSHSSSPSRLCVLRDSIRSHRLRAQSWKTTLPPTLGANHKSSCYLCFFLSLVASLACRSSWAGDQNLHHRCYPSHSSGNIGFLTCCTTGILLSGFLTSSALDLDPSSSINLLEQFT